MEAPRVATGAKELDKFLEGGYETDAITTIYGPAGSGKTNIALLAAIATAQKGKKVIFIDTEGGFSLARLRQLCPKHKKVLENILFLKPTTFAEQYKTIAKLRNIISDKVGLIIVDTIAMLYRLERSREEMQEFNRELGIQIAILNEIARKKNIPVLVTNQVYTSFETGRISMVGGDLLKYTSKCLIELQPLNKSFRKAVLRKHRSIAGEKELFFEITNTGIRAGSC